MSEVKPVFSSENILSWLGYYAKMLDTSPEKFMLLNICGKERNVIPAIRTHKRVMVFADGEHEDIFYEFWIAGLGEYDIWYSEGLEPTQQPVHTKIKNLINVKLKAPTVFLVMNENTRESYQIGIKNENFTRGSVRYVGNEIRAVIMSMLEIDSNDTICIVSGESIVIESAMAASYGNIIAVEYHEDDQDTMEQNIEQFGVRNVQIVPDLSKESLDSMPVPRLAFIVATNKLEEEIQSLLLKNPKMKFVIYTLELDILSSIKSIFKIYNIQNMEVTQIAVSKINKNSVFVAQPSPWLITGEAE